MVESIVNGPPSLPPGTKVTRDIFEEFLAWPWYINNLWLDDVACIRKLYKELIEEANTLSDMLEVIDLFGWLAWDAKRIYKQFVNHRNFKRVKMMIVKGTGAETFAPMIVPEMMLWATIISKKYTIPEFPAVCQYARARYFNVRKEPSPTSDLPDQTNQKGISGSDEGIG